MDGMSFAEREAQRRALDSLRQQASQVDRDAENRKAMADLLFGSEVNTPWDQMGFPNGVVGTPRGARAERENRTDDEKRASAAETIARAIFGTLQ